MTTQYRVTSVKTRLWNSLGEIILGQALKCSLRTIVSHVRLALGPKRHTIGHTDFFNNSRSRRNHGIQFQSILLISYHLPQANTSILVIVDRLTKQAIFIAPHDTITSAQLAELFVIHVFSKHGVPAHVTSDRGPEFVSHFFRSLGKALNMKLHFTSGYHPEGDGQTERTNQTLEQYLRMYCNYQQDNWKGLLPLAEFAFKNAPSATTGISPFFANKGYHPNITVHPS